MCPLSCGCPQNVARTQCSLKRHMNDVSTVLRLSTECGQNTTKLKHLENVCVCSDVFVWTVASPCFYSLPCCFVSLSVLSVYCGCPNFFPVYLVQHHKLLQAAMQLHLLLCRQCTYSLFRTRQYDFEILLHYFIFPVIIRSRFIMMLCE